MVLASMTKLSFQSQAVTLHLSGYVINWVELIITSVIACKFTIWNNSSWKGKLLANFKQTQRHAHMWVWHRMCINSCILSPFLDVVFLLFTSTARDVQKLPLVSFHSPFISLCVSVKIRCTCEVGTHCKAFRSCYFLSFLYVCHSFTH